jgi:MFS family permease
MSKRTFLGFSAYQWLVLFAAWLGWGFDVFDALLFNYVSRLCIPALLPESRSTSQDVVYWTGAITSVLLVGWGVGGIVFGKITDRIGRTKTLLLTMLTYSISTAACALAPNLPVLIFFRFVASLGIGGEWAAGASLVAETVPENKRVQAGALLYTAAPAGLFLATFVTDLFTRQVQSIASNPELSWRLVFLTGLVPAAIAIVVRLRVKESEVWKKSEERPHFRALFSADLRWRTIGGLFLSSVALITWWSCNAFIPLISSLLAQDSFSVSDASNLAALKAAFVKVGTTWFNLGGLIGTFLTVPVAIFLGRRPMYIIYFLCSALAIWLTFRLALPPEPRMLGFFFVGLSVFGIFGSFTFYLPELFPVHLRATGSGFCYNTGRFLTALGPFIVGDIASHAHNSHEVLTIVSWVGAVPALGVVFLLMGLGHETKKSQE